MLDAEMQVLIRALAHNLNYSQTQIAQFAGVSLPTVRKYLKKDKIEASAKKRKRTCIVEKQGFHHRVHEWIASKEQGAEKSTVLDLYEELKDSGYTGSYETLARYIRSQSVPE